MTDEQFVKAKYPSALAFKRYTRSGYKHRIGRFLVTNGNKPENLSSECKSESAAWKSARQRIERNTAKPTGRTPLYHGKDA